MKYFLVLFMALVASSAVAQRRYDITMIVDSIPREFIVVKPSGAAPAGGYPIVFMFHGSSGDGQKFYNISGWKEKGEEEKFITVFPSSLAYCIIDSGREKRITKWNNGNTQEDACPGEMLADDVHFVRVMIDTIQNAFPIDRARIYASGFSNGGVFVAKLAVEMSDLFAAIAMASGGLNPLDSSAPKRNIPLAYMVGNKDEHILGKLGIPEIPFNDSALAILEPVTNSHLETFGLTSDFTKTETLNTITWHYSTPASAVPATEFNMILVRDMGHEYPNGTNHPTSAANALWKFFQQLRGVSSVDGKVAQDNSIRFYPNPARALVTIECEGMTRVVLRNLLGQSVRDEQMRGSGTIGLQGIPAGLYIIETHKPSGLSVGTLRVE